MNDEQIAKKIAEQCVIAVVLSKCGHKERAGLFARHAIRLIAANKPAVQRWMASRAAREER